MTEVRTPKWAPVKTPATALSLTPDDSQNSLKSLRRNSLSSSTPSAPVSGHSKARQSISDSEQVSSFAPRPPPPTTSNKHQLRSNPNDDPAAQSSATDEQPPTENGPATRSPGKAKRNKKKKKKVVHNEGEGMVEKAALTKPSAAAEEEEEKPVPPVNEVTVEQREAKEEEAIATGNEGDLSHDDSDSPMADAPQSPQPPSEDEDSKSTNMDVDEPVPPPPASTTSDDTITPTSTHRPLPPPPTSAEQVPLPPPDSSEEIEDYHEADSDDSDSVLQGRRSNNETKTSPTSPSWGMANLVSKVVTPKTAAEKQRDAAIKRMAAEKKKADEEKRKREEETRRREAQEREYRRQKKTELLNIIAQHGEYAVMAHIDEMNARASQLTRDNEALASRLKRGEEREEVLQRDLQQKEKLAKAAQTELADSRAFVEGHDSGDVETVKRELGKVSSQLDDLIFRMIDDITGPGATKIDFQERVPITDEMLAFIMSFADPLFAELGQMMASAPERGVWDYICYGSMSITSVLIDANVFKSFKPGMSEEEGRVIKAAYARIKKNEPQGKAGRWRSITYEHLHPSSESDDAALAEQIAKAIIDKITSLIQPVFHFLAAVESSNPPVVESDEDKLVDKKEDIEVGGELEGEEKDEIEDEEKDKPDDATLVEPSSTEPSLLTSSESTNPVRRPLPPPLTLSTYLSEFTELVLNAIKWHSRMRRHYLSYDYIATLQQPKNTSEDDTLIAAQGFGLKRVRGVQQTVGGKVEIEVEWLMDTPGMTVKDLNQ